MADLTGRSPGDTYGNLLNIDNSNNGINGTLRDVQDGKGTVGPVKMSTTGLRVNAAAAFDAESGATADFANFTVTNLPSWNLVGTNSPTSGSSFTITGIPASATVIKVVFTDMDFSVASRVYMQIMDNSVTQTTGYQCSSLYYNNTTIPSVAVSVTLLHMLRLSTDGVSQTQSGVGYLSKNDTTGEWFWVCDSRMNDSVTPTKYVMSRAIGQPPSVVTALDGLAFTTITGTFAAGTVSVYSSGE